MIYLDNASTTKPSKKAVDAAIKAAEVFGNPSSLHKLGLDAEKVIKGSKNTIANILGVQNKNIYFTSGGTESNTTAILGSVNIKRGNHVITTKIEHPSVLENFKILENRGFDVTYLDVDKNGVINLEELKNSLRKDTLLVSVMNVNNETGMIQPVDKIKSIMKETAPKAKFHVDAVQSFCKIDLKPKLWGIDMLSISAHKIHGFKGCGALYIENTNIRPLLNGGGQQNGIRPGTENVMGIAAFGAVAENVDIAKNRAYMMKLRNMLKEGLINEIENIKINGADELSSGNILNVSFLGIKAEILLHTLERKEIYVSTGSACSSNKPMPSHVLMAMGCNKKEIEGAIRFSIDENITKEDIETTIKVVKEEVENIRKYVR